MGTRRIKGLCRAPGGNGRGFARVSAWEVVGGAVLLAAVLLGLVAAPGLVSDRDSTAPLHPVREARQ